MQKYLFRSLHRLLGQWWNKRNTQITISYYFFVFVQGFCVKLSMDFIYQEKIQDLTLCQNIIDFFKDHPGATTGSVGTIGVFLGCTYTNPLTKQKAYAQYWPAGTLAGDAVAIVTDDPDTLFKVAAVTAAAGTTIGSVARAMIGLNVNGSDGAGSTASGNSGIAIVPSVAVANTSTLPFRIVDVVPDTAVASTATLSSGGGSTSLVVTGLTSTLPVGTEVGYLAANGQYIGSGSWVSAAVTGTGSQTISINSQAVTVNSPTGTASTGITIPAASTLVFTQYPEAVVKFNFGIHEYYTNTAQAATL